MWRHNSVFALIFNQCFLVLSRLWCCNRHSTSDWLSLTRLQQHLTGIVNVVPLLPPQSYAATTFELVKYFMNCDHAFLHLTSLLRALFVDDGSSKDVTFSFYFFLVFLRGLFFNVGYMKKASKKLLKSCYALEEIKIKRYTILSGRQ